MNDHMNKNITYEKWKNGWRCIYTSPVKNEWGLSNKIYGYGKTKEDAMENLNKNASEEW